MNKLVALNLRLLIHVLQVPNHIVKPPYAATGLVHPSPPYVVLQVILFAPSFYLIRSWFSSRILSSTLYGVRSFFIAYPCGTCADIKQTEQDVAGLRKAAKIARTALELTCKLAAVNKHAFLCITPADA